MGFRLRRCTMQQKQIGLYTHTGGARGILGDETVCEWISRGWMGRGWQRETAALCSVGIGRMATSPCAGKGGLAGRSADGSVLARQSVQRLQSRGFSVVGAAHCEPVAALLQQAWRSVGWWHGQRRAQADPSGTSPNQSASSHNATARNPTHPCLPIQTQYTPFAHSCQTLQAGEYHGLGYTLCGRANNQHA
jgi:hypothetical protein